MGTKDQALTSTFILAKIKGYGIQLWLFLLSFYTAALFFPLLHLKYTNPENIAGPIATASYNPNNNTLRFLFVIILTPLLYLFLNRVIAQQKWRYARYLVILIATASTFFAQTQLYFARFTNIDMFHDGEQLGVGSAIALFNKKPFTDIFFLHGAFTDPYIAVASFKLFGYSISSFYLLNSLLIILTVFLFYLLLHILIRNNLLFFIASVFFYGALSLLSFFLGREIAPFVFILLLYGITKARIPTRIGFFLVGFLGFVTFYIAVDRGLYLFITGLLFTTLYCLFDSKFFLTPVKQSVPLLVRRWNYIAAWLLGTAAAILSGILLFGQRGFADFLHMTFIQIPKMSPLMFDYIYPKFTLDTLFPFWWPIIIITVLLIFVIKHFFKYRTVLDVDYLFVTILVIMAVIFYKSGLGRNELGHIAYIIHFSFLACFVVLDYLLAREALTFNRLGLYGLSLLLFLTPFFNLKQVIQPPKYETFDVKIYFNLPTIEDNYWLTSEVEQVRDYIMQNTSKDDYVFDFTNQAAYYYLIQRQNPTNYYMVWFASPQTYQQQALAQLMAHKPKYIIYTSSYWSNAIDNIGNVHRVPLINKWILENYTEDKVIESTKILKLSTNNQEKVQSSDHTNTPL